MSSIFSQANGATMSKAIANFMLLSCSYSVDFSILDSRGQQGLFLNSHIVTDSRHESQDFWMTMFAGNVFQERSPTSKLAFQDLQGRLKDIPARSMVGSISYYPYPIGIDFAIRAIRRRRVQCHVKPDIREGERIICIMTAVQELVADHRKADGREQPRGSTRRIADLVGDPDGLLVR